MTEGREPGEGAARSRWTWLFVAAVFALLAARLFRLVDLHAVDLLFWDQWDLVEAFMRGAGPWELFRWSHGPHRQGVGFLLTKVVMEASAWNVRAEAFSIAAVVVLATGLALWLRVRLFGDLRPADVAIPLLLLTPAQYGIFIHTPNAAHGAVPLLLLVALALVWTLPGRSARCGLAVLGSFLLVHTGFGFFAAFLVPLLLIAECRAAQRAGEGRGAALAAVVAALACIAVFFFGYTFDSAVEGFGFPSPQWPLYPVYVCLMLSNVLGLKGGGGLSLLVGFGVLAAAVWTLVKQGWVLLRQPEEGRGAAEVLVLLTGFGLLFCLGTAVGRISLGLQTAQSTRYVPLVAPLFLALYLQLHTLRDPTRRLLATLLAAAACALATVPMRAQEAEFMQRLSADKRQWVETYLATASIDAADRASGRRVHPRPRETRLEQKLAWLRERELSFFHR